MVLTLSAHRLWLFLTFYSICVQMFYKINKYIVFFYSSAQLVLGYTIAHTQRWWFLLLINDRYERLVLFALLVCAFLLFHFKAWHQWKKRGGGVILEDSHLFHLVKVFILFLWHYKGAGNWRKTTEWELQTVWCVCCFCIYLEAVDSSLYQAAE